MGRKTPSYVGLSPASARASASARGASRKSDTRPEVMLRARLHRAGLRFRKDVRALPGRPDIVFPGARVVVFCDGDFWHGRDFALRRRKLAAGTNAAYWIEKIARNMARDAETQERLEARGYRVLRFWESEITADVDKVAGEIALAVTGLDEET